ncbi:L-type lectin-domain containing receptor kinase IX.1-like [Cryptomeria japonica]|uniref:L-type lectin-domain containing receptor kinase IX.1-like n=1 Tax=Cryptomeria japonica TaxID=3369 RepID=UPI0027DA20E7|nr:L-type lectin-domain containing receptor kinase IX.1-like [Cryptomeria japonica]
MISFSFIIFIFNFVLAYKFYGSTRKSSREDSDENLDRRFQKSVHSVRKFPYRELVAATENFSEVIGQGGSGSVYRGTLSGTNEVVAVKRIKANSDEGKKEYEAEVIINGNILHRNLVKFLGWCHHKDKLFLVYEFLPKRSLDKYIFGKPEYHLDWDNRYRITSEIASVLYYLHAHSPKSVVHRDIKASNVMLDSDFTAKLGDFGLARALKDEFKEYTTCPAGTIGYLAPETLTTGKASRESDMYSFGALALAISCGRPPADDRLDKYSCSLVKWVWHCKIEGRIIDAADEKFDGNFNVEQMERLMSVGLLCCHPEPKERPPIEQVMAMLKTTAELSPIPHALYGEPIQLEVGLPSVETSDAI